MRWILLVCVLVVCGSCWPAASAVPIEGNLWISGSQVGGGWYAYYLHGTSDQATLWPGPIEHADISPLGNAVVHQVTTEYPYTATGDIWVTSLDGATAVNVSQAAGLTGVNCFPSWAPDAGRIAFRHAEPTAGQQPCDAGFQVWVMNADGMGARRVSPDGAHSIKLAGWSADGHQVIGALDDGSAVSMALEGGDPQSLPNMRGEGADFSPDGRHVAGRRDEEDAPSGGAWRELVIADPDGGNPQVAVREFINHADAAAMVARLGLEPAEYYIADLEWRIGPLFPQWSPMGDRIAFLAAMPFDPNGADYREQVNVWIYTVATGELTKITENSQQRDTWLSWSGENTFADHTEVTVDNVTVAFSQADQPGLTTVIWQDDPPALRATYQPVGPVFRITTTAQVAGPTTVSMAYTAGDLPAAAESHLQLLRYDETVSAWEDITVSRDTVGDVVQGQTEALGVMCLAWPLPESHFSDISSSPSNPFWALWEIEATYAAGIVQGYDDGSYQPIVAVTRDQMAVYIARAVAGGDAAVPTGPATATFEDAPNTGYGGDGTDPYWAYRYIEYCVDQGVVQGYDATHYWPEVAVTRDQMAVFAARAKGWVHVGDDMTTAPDLFPDVPAGYWSGTAIQACVDHGVVQGYDDGKYHPEYQVTRDQMAVYVARAFELPM